MTRVSACVQKRFHSIPVIDKQISNSQSVNLKAEDMPKREEERRSFRWILNGLMLMYFQLLLLLRLYLYRIHIFRRLPALLRLWMYSQENVNFLPIIWIAISKLSSSYLFIFAHINVRFASLSAVSSSVWGRHGHELLQIRLYDDYFTIFRGRV